jgi:hypothetical protein
MYKIKRNSWALIAGGYLTYWGAAGLLKPLIGPMGFARSFAAMFFIVPAVIFLILFYDKNKRGLLAPASFMLGLGLFVFMLNSPFLPEFITARALLCFCVALSCFIDYFLGKRLDEIKQGWLYVGLVFLSAGVFTLINIPVLGILGNIIPAVLIVVSIVIIARAVRNKP